MVGDIATTISSEDLFEWGDVRKFIMATLEIVVSNGLVNMFLLVFCLFVACLLVFLVNAFKER